MLGPLPLSSRGGSLPRLGALGRSVPEDGLTDQVEDADNRRDAHDHDRPGDDQHLALVGVLLGCELALLTDQRGGVVAMS